MIFCWYGVMMLFEMCRLRSRNWWVVVFFVV